MIDGYDKSHGTFYNPDVTRYSIGEMRSELTEMRRHAMNSGYVNVLEVMGFDDLFGKTRQSLLSTQWWFDV